MYNMPLFINKIILYNLISPIYLFSPIIMMMMNNWILIWMSMEINLIMFTPMLIFWNKDKEIASKYFIIQVFSSMMFLLTSIMLIQFKLMNLSNFNNLINFILSMMIITKMGGAPFHFWFIFMMSNLEWKSCFLLSTWQKITPMITMLYLNNLMMMYWTMIFSIMIGSLFGLLNSSIRNILAYSSLSQMSWMLLILCNNELFWIIYFFIYLLVNLLMMLILNHLKIYYLNHLYLIPIKYKLIFVLNFFSLMGIPPLMGFYMKWNSLWIMNNFNFISLIFVMMSILSFIYYFRMMMMFLMFFNNNNKQISFSKFKINIKIISLIILMSMIWMMNILLI